MWVRFAVVGANQTLEDGAAVLLCGLAQPILECCALVIADQRGIDGAGNWRAVNDLLRVRRQLGAGGLERGHERR